MGVLRYSIAVFTALIGITVYLKLQPPPLPTLDPNPWWGPGQPKKEDAAIKPFSIKITDQELQDFNTRLSLPPRYTPPLEGSNFTYGFSSDVLDQLVKYWKNEYNVKERMQLLNKYPHFTTQIEGLRVHFLRIVPKATPKVKTVPLLLIHGWPGSFVEFMDIIPMLTTPRKNSDVVFELIIPSLPGYGFSQGTSKQGLGAVETGQILLKLMKRLGHEKFYVQGGDWGSLVATSMVTMFEQHIIGIHVNMAPGLTGKGQMLMMLGSILPSGVLFSKEEAAKLYPMSSVFYKLMKESAYAHIQATKPDTIGAALNTSPVALLVYIMEKFSSWTHDDYIAHPNGGLLDPSFPIARDKLLDNICIYWFSKSIVTSQRYYAENLNIRSLSMNMDSIPTKVPAGVSSFPQEVLFIPKRVAEVKFHNLVSFKEMKSGGHFAAMEVPDDLAEHVFEFVNIVEKLKS